MTTTADEHGGPYGVATRAAKGVVEANGAAQVKKEMSDRATRRRSVFNLLADGRWHRTTEFQRADVGGSEGMRRVREVRADVKAGKHRGWKALVKRKAAGSSQYEYRLVPDAAQSELF